MIEYLMLTREEASRLAARFGNEDGDEGLQHDKANRDSSENCPPLVDWILCSGECIPVWYERAKSAECK